MKNKIKFLIVSLTGCILAGCTCYSTHVPGRRVDHGPNPGGIDIFFCNLDYILFPPQQGYVVPPPPPPKTVIVTPPPVVIPEYNYGWWKETWVPRYNDWYWYHGTWVWGGTGPRPVPPAWAPDFKRRPMPPPPPRKTAIVVTTAPPPPPPQKVVIINNNPPPKPVVVINNNHRPPKQTHIHKAPSNSRKPAARPNRNINTPKRPNNFVAQPRKNPPPKPNR